MQIDSGRFVHDLVEQDGAACQDLESDFGEAGIMLPGGMRRTLELVWLSSRSWSDDDDGVS
jgi:hypothetical protein